MPTFQSDDAVIHYQTWGKPTQPALIFSNSLGTQLSMWQAQIEYFQKDHFVIAYDTRGHGQSTAPQGPYSIEQLGQDVIHLLDQLNIQKTDFCGISMGGLTGQWLAIHHPQRFNHVVICNTAAKIGQESAWLARAELVREQGLTPIAETAALRWFTEPFIQSQTAIVKSMSNDLAASSAEGYASCCEALAKADLTTQINSITVPVLVIAGAQDPVTTVVDGQFMQQQIPASELFVIEASHISNVEKPQQFNQALADFLIS